MWKGKRRNKVGQGKMRMGEGKVERAEGVLTLKAPESKQ